MKALFISREDLIRFTPISGNIDFDKIVQYIEIAQDIHIHEILGTDLYTQLNDSVVASTLSVADTALLKDWIKPTLCQFAFLEYLPFSQYTIGNKGVFKHTSEDSNAPLSDEIDRMKAATRETANHYAKRLISHLCNNPSLYPTYLTNTNEDVRPTKKASIGGWNI
jgi:hypothetical protein